MSPCYDDERVAARLDAGERLDGVEPSQFLSDAGLLEGDTVVDFGCGPGYLTLPAAEIVGPAGRVYAIDIEPKMVDLAGKRATEAGLTDVTVGLTEGERTPLPDVIADFAICALVLHYREDHTGRLALARDMARLMRPGGRAVVVEWTPKESSDNHQRSAYADVAEIFGAAGLECGAPEAIGEKQYMMIATRKG